MYDDSLALEKIPVMEMFYSIQGEGVYQGNAAFFIRLAGCDVGCFWCDVKESWQIHEHQWVTYRSILADIKKTNTQIVIVTGGEPLMHHCEILTSMLHNDGYKTHIETSGSHPLSGTWDWICLSPKKFKQPLPQIYTLAHELKVVIYNQNDFKWALQEAEKVSSFCKKILQPEWSVSEKMLPYIIDFVLKNPDWKLNLQIHKYLNVR